MTLTNVAQYVSLLRFDLEVCKVAFRKESSATRSRLLDQVDKIHKAEAEIVEKKACPDVATLLAKVTLAWDYLPSEDSDLAGYLR